MYSKEERKQYGFGKTRGRVNNDWIFISLIELILSLWVGLYMYPMFLHWHSYTEKQGQVKLEWCDSIRCDYWPEKFENCCYIQPLLYLTAILQNVLINVSHVQALKWLMLTHSAHVNNFLMTSSLAIMPSQSRWWCWTSVCDEIHSWKCYKDLQTNFYE